MSNLSFKKGLEANLPSQLDNGTFYVVEDTKKVIIDGITLQDGDNLMASLEESMEAYTPVVDFNEEHEARVAREEEIADEVAYLKEEVEKSEKVVAAALTDLHNTKQDELIDGVNIKTINGESLLGGGNITIDLDLFLVVSELPTENINPNKIYLVQNENSETGNEYIEYMYVESSQQWEEVGKYTTAIDLTPYALSADVETSINSLNDSVNTVETTLTNKLNAEISARQKDVEDINKAIEENELVTITALTDLEERKLDKMDLPNFDAYATEEWVEEQIANINVGGGGSGDVNLDGYATEEWVENKGYITSAALNDYALSADVETAINEVKDIIIDNEEVIAAALTDLETKKLNATDLEANLEGYATEQWVEDKGYLTDHQDISGKQDVIADLDVIRSGASLGATALQSVPSEYVTETELNAKGYITDAYSKAEVDNKVSSLNTNKQDKLVSGTNVKTINGESILGNGDITIDLDLFLVVSELPTTDINPNKIYLIHNADSEAGNEYIEYVYMESTQKWEEIGKYKADIDLADYATKTWVNDEYLPLSGGTVDGNINANKISSYIYAFRSGAYNEQWGYLTVDDSKKNKIYYVDKDSNYNTIIHSGNISSYALPLTGGTLTNTGTILGINRTDGNPMIGFNNNGNRLGWLGFNTSYEPIAQVLENENFAARKIIHSGNYSNYALPKTGGTINGTSYNPLSIASNSDDLTQVYLYTKDTLRGIVQYNVNYGVGFSNSGIGGIYVKDNGTPIFNDSSNTSKTLLHEGNYSDYALPLSGGNLEGALRYNSHLAIPKAEYKASGDVTGCIKIKIPADPGSAMLSFWVDVFNYSNGSSYSVYISGYAFNDNKWYQPTTFFIGNTSKIVKYGHDGTNFIICIGLPTDTYNHPNIIIRNVLLGHNAKKSSFNNKWDISITNDVSDISFNNSNECLVLNTTNYSTYALPLSGGTITSTEQGIAPLMLNSIDNSGHSILQFANKGTYLGALGFSSVDTPYFRTSAGFVRNLIHSGNIGEQSVASATSATAAKKTGNGSLLLYPENSNEINFGGTGSSTDIYFGYRQKDDRPVPTQYTFGNGGSANIKASKFIGDLEGNATYATSAGISAGIICTGAGDNIDRPLVATNEENKLYYSSLVKLNYSTGNITAPKFTGNLIGNASSATKATQDSDGNAINTTYLKKSGGTISSSSAPLTINRQLNGDGYSSISYSVNDSLVGVLGFNKNGIPVVSPERATNSEYHVIVHAGNYTSYQVDTKDTAGSTNDTSNKLFIVGAKTQGANPQTYSNANVYISNSKVYANDFDTTSDARLKDFVSDVDVDFNELKSIPKKYYYWKDKSMGENLQLGTSAQELAKVYPECVSYNETEDRYSVNYQKLSIIALAAIDKLHERISVLEEKLNEKK